MVEDIIKELNRIKGLGNVKLLEKEDIDVIRNLEEERNIGVLDCLERDFVLILTHDSSFRNPKSNIVREENGILFFPGVDFPEVSGKDVVSSCPCKEVHDFLIKKFNLKLKDEATLLIGFNL